MKAILLIPKLFLIESKITSFPQGTFSGIAFNCDLNLPKTVKTVGSNFNYNGCFKNITIPSSVTTLNAYCFGAATSSPISDFYLNTVTFESPTPMTIGVTCFAVQNMENNFKIYVPDESVEEYKAVTNLNMYANYIHPVSEKE